MLQILLLKSPKKLCLKISKNIQSIPAWGSFFPRGCFRKLAKVQRTSHHWYILGCLLWLGEGSVGVRDIAVGDWLTCAARFGQTRRVGWWWSLALLIVILHYYHYYCNHNRFYTYFLFVIYRGSHWTHCYHCFHDDLIIGTGAKWDRFPTTSLVNQPWHANSMTSLFDSVTIRYDHIVGRTSSCVADKTQWEHSLRSWW